MEMSDVPWAVECINLEPKIVQKRGLGWRYKFWNIYCVCGIEPWAWGEHSEVQVETSTGFLRMSYRMSDRGEGQRERRREGEGRELKRRQSPSSKRKSQELEICGSQGWRVFRKEGQ